MNTLINDHVKNALQHVHGKLGVTSNTRQRTGQTVNAISQFTLCLAFCSLTATSYAGGTASAVMNSMTLKSEAKTIKVRNGKDLSRAFKMVTKNNHSAIVITCHPPDNDWCANEFQTRCTDAGGGLSTEPDGGIACSNDNW